MPKKYFTKALQNRIQAVFEEAKDAPQKDIESLLGKIYALRPEGSETDVSFNKKFKKEIKRFKSTYPFEYKDKGDPELKKEVDAYVKEVTQSMMRAEKSMSREMAAEKMNKFYKLRQQYLDSFSNPRARQEVAETYERKEKKLSDVIMGKAEPTPTRITDKKLDITPEGKMEARGYKEGVDVEEGRKRREEATVRTRKKKKAEAMAKKRRPKALEDKKKMDVEEEDEDVEMTKQKPLALEDIQEAEEDEDVEMTEQKPLALKDKKQRPGRKKPITKEQKRKQLKRAQQIRKRIANLQQQLLLEEDAANEEKQGEKVAIVPVSATPQAGDPMPLGPRAEEESKSADLGRMEMLKDGGDIIHVDEDLVKDDETKVEPMDVDKQPEEMEQRQAPVQPQAQTGEERAPAASGFGAEGDAMFRQGFTPVQQPEPMQDDERKEDAPAVRPGRRIQPEVPPPSYPPAQEAKPPGMPAGPPEEFVQEKFAYPDAPPHHLGIKAVPPSMDLDMEKRQRMSKSIDVLKTEIKCFRELYKGKIRTKKFLELAKINMTQKSLDEVRKIHKQYSDIIRDYYTHSRGLRVGVIVDPAILGLNVSALQSLLAPRVPSYAPVVNAAREGDKLYPKGERDKQQAAIRIAETHYQQGGMRHATGDYDRDVEAINRSIDKEEIRKEKNRSTTRLPGKLPVFKNYMYRARPTQIASGIKINTS